MSAKLPRIATRRPRATCSHATSRDGRRRASSSTRSGAGWCARASAAWQCRPAQRPLARRVRRTHRPDRPGDRSMRRKRRLGSRARTAGGARPASAASGRAARPPAIAEPPRGAGWRRVVSSRARHFSGAKQHSRHRPLTVSPASASGSTVGSVSRGGGSRRHVRDLASYRCASCVDVPGAFPPWAEAA